MEKSLNASLAEFASSLRYRDLSNQVIEKAKICVLDFLGAAVAGYKMEVSQLAIQTTKLLSAPGRATILIDGHKGRAIDCVLANSVLAHSCLLEDWLPISLSHIGISVIPTVLAIAEEGNYGGRDVLLAIVVGYEVEDRIGVLTVPMFKRGFRATTIYAYFGSASAAAKLMGLSSEQFKNALGCAGSIAGGLLQPVVDGSMEWSLGEAFGCRGGILSALLAQQGLRGADDILEGECGLNQCFAGTVEGLEKTLEGLGEHFHILDTISKPFPSGGLNQASISAALDLAQRYRIDYRKIRAVRVKIPSSGTTERIDYAGMLSYKGPFRSIDQCLFSKPFGIAAALKNATYDIDIVKREKDNPEIAELAQKIDLEEIKEVQGWPSYSMEIELEDGTVVHGDSSNVNLQDFYLDSDRAREKFIKMASRGLGMKRTKQVVDLVSRLEELDSIAPIMEQMIG